MKKQKVQYNHKTINKGLIPPQSVAIEEAILGGMLIDSRSIDTVLMLLKSSEVFYKEHHQYIFEAIQQLSSDNKKIDPLTVGNQLRKNEKLEEAGGDFYLIELMQKVSSTANIEDHCKIVLQYWVKRCVIELSRVCISNAYAEATDIFDLMAEAEQMLDTVNAMITLGKQSLSFDDALYKVIERVEMLTNKSDKDLTGVKTGLRNLDTYTGGWQDKDLIVIAARPGMGKTSLILKGISESVLSSEPVGIFSLEMDVQQLVTRMVSINSNLHLTQLLKKGFEKEKYFGSLNEVVNRLTGLPVFIDDTPTLTIHQLCMKARVLKRKNNIKVLYVDYLQLLNGDGKSGNREQEISLISRKLKALAKELNIPVIALSQLSRAVETRGGTKRPMLSDLRESGAIEQDADIVAFIHRPEYYGMEVDDDTAMDGSNSEFIIAKYRGGSVGTLGMYWLGDKTKFMDPEDRLTELNNIDPF